MAVTLCPIALAVGCRKCPVFKVCPVKGLIGDQRPRADEPAVTEPPRRAKHAAKPGNPGPKRKRSRSGPRRRGR
jgi:hypothetical protein